MLPSCVQCLFFTTIILLFASSATVLSLPQQSRSVSMAEAEANAADFLLPSHKISKRATSEKSNGDLWPDGVVYYYIDPLLDEALVNNASWVFYYLYSISCLQFVPFDSFLNDPTKLTPQGHRAYVNVTVSTSTVCWVDTGFPGRNGVLTMYLGTECANNIHNMAHMALHVLGFFHEHQRPDRDYYVQIFWQHIMGGLAQNFQKFRDNDTDWSSPYDISSIMHFKSKFDQKNTELVMQPWQYLFWTASESAGDNLGGDIRADVNPFSHRDLVKIHTIYNCSCAYKNLASRCPTIGTATDKARCANNYGYVDVCCNCVCPEGFQGQYCEDYVMNDVTDSCGGIITNGVGTITSPNYPNNYKTGATCRYLLKNPDKNGKVCFLINDLSVYDSNTDSFYGKLYYPGVDIFKIDVAMAANYQQEWYQSQTEMASIEFMSRYSCPPNSPSCNNKGKGFKVTYNIGCVGLMSNTQIKRIAWDTNPDMAYLGLYPPDNLRIMTCLTIPCIYDGNCEAEKNVWDTYMCGCSAIAGEDLRCLPQYNVQTFHVVARMDAYYINTLSDKTSFDFYTLKARICNWVYDGIKHLEIAAHYRSCFRMTARNGSVIVDYSFAFNTSYALSAVQLNKAFNFQAANASEGKVRLVTGDANYIISDVNECADSSLWKCPTNSQCVNTQGRYTCTCNTGCHYVWPYGARDIGYCLCDGTSGPNVDGSLNSDASFWSTNTTFQWWWIVVGLCAFIFVVCCCCVPFCVCCWRRRRVYADEELEESFDSSQRRRRWSGSSGESYRYATPPRRLPRTIIRTMPRNVVGQSNYFI